MITTTSPPEEDEIETTMALEDWTLWSETSNQCQPNYDLGTFSNAVQCAAAAIETSRCGAEDGTVSIMWNDYWSSSHESWGCRCCESDSSYSDHGVWTLMTYHSDGWKQDADTDFLMANVYIIWIVTVLVVIFCVLCCFIARRHYVKNGAWFKREYAKVQFDTAVEAADHEAEDDEAEDDEAEDDEAEDDEADDMMTQ